MSNTTTINVTSKVTLLYGTKGGVNTPFLIVNLDTINSIWVANTQLADPGSPTSVEVGPLASLSFDGSVSVYGITLPNISVQVILIPGGTGYTTGAPANAPVDTLLSQSDVGGQIVQASNTHSVFAGNLTGTSYQLAVDALIQTGAPTTPFYEVILDWRNNGVLVDFQHWVVLATNVSPANANSLFSLRGPTVAQHLGVTIKNYDVNNILCDFSLYQSSRVVSKHYGMQVSNNILNTYNYQGLSNLSTPNSEPTALVLGNSLALVVAGGLTQDRINAVWSGNAQLSYSLAPQPGVNLDMVVSLFCVDPNYTGVGNLGPLQPILYTDLFTSSQEVGVITQISLPRLPTVISFQNNDPVNAVDVTWSLVGTETTT